IEAVKAELLKLGLHNDKNKDLEGQEACQDQKDLPDLETNNQLLKGFLSQNPKMVLANPSFYLREKTIDPKDSEGNIQPTDMGLLSTYDKVIHNLKPLLKDPDQNKGNTSYMELDIQPLIQTYRDFQMLMEDSDEELSDDDILEAEEDMDDPFPLPNDEETQPPPSTEQT
nr:hypothetical protein [Tanacetum cinerariifolium]